MTTFFANIFTANFTKKCLVKVTVKLLMVRPEAADKADVIVPGIMVTLCCSTIGLITFIAFLYSAIVEGMGGYDGVMMELMVKIGVKYTIR